MAGITLAQAQAQLDVWLAASTALASNQSYEIAGRKITRNAEVIEKIEYWNQQVQQLSARASGRGRSRTITVGF